MKDTSELFRRSIGKWRIATFVLLLVSLGLLVALLVVVFVKNDSKIDETQVQIPVDVPPCGAAQKSAINLEEPANPSVFHDLTSTEITGLMKYLYAQPSLNLVKPEAKISKSYVFTAEVYLPPKQQVLDHLDRGNARPVREAVVTIFRGDVKEPHIQEVLVGPLPEPSYMKDVPGRRKKIPFNYRPFTTPELRLVYSTVHKVMHSKAGDLLKESFDASLVDCGAKCIGTLFMVPVSSAVSGKDKRYTWMNFEHKAEFRTLFPLDFAVLIEHNFTEVVFHQVWYNGKMFDSIEDLVQQYKNGTIDKIRVTFPSESQQSFATLKARGNPFQDKFAEDPIQVSPGGKRYSIEHNHVEYRGWSFDYRMSTLSGPQIYDIRYKSERIVYELSLQEIMVLYSGHKPSQMFADVFDGVALMGAQAKGLVPGVDCPADATYLSARHVVDFSEESILMQNVLCMFEWNTGLPLRRHLGNFYDPGGFYEGLPNVVLTLRTMFTITNYDYIFDFIFYQNGVIQVKAASTGYIISTTPNPSEAPYGKQLHDNLLGPMHVHFFHFKADIDIKGTVNQYETLNVVPTTVPNTFLPDPASDYHQTKFTQNLKETEQDAAYKFNFDEPKYLIFYNNQTKSKYGVPKGYRIMNTGMAKQLYTEGRGNEPSASWARYQMAVTKHKDTERTSSSLYAYRDSADPVVQFQKYLDDNETIVDEDLVAWLTLGVHHIPHTEDLPVTPSPGMDLSFYLLPYNYFAEDPAMASRHSVRFEFKNKQNTAEGLKLTRYGPKQTTKCVPPKNVFLELLSNS